MKFTLIDSKDQMIFLNKPRPRHIFLKHNAHYILDLHKLEKLVDESGITTVSRDSNDIPNGSSCNYTDVMIVVSDKLSTKKANELAEYLCQNY